MPTHFGKSLSFGLMATIAVVGLSACQTTGFDQQAEGIGYRAARFAEVSAMRDWRQCRDDALELDRQARESGDAARYLASAKMLDRCEADIGPDAAGAAKDERFRAYALVVQNHLKGGDVAQARTNLERLQQAFPSQDLYLADGSSFITTMEILLGTRDRTAVGEFGVANVNSDLKAELRRVHYWKSH